MKITTGNDDNLKPCPFCGNMPSEIVMDHRYSGRWPFDFKIVYSKISCGCCNLTVEEVPGIRDAMEIWNRREGMKAVEHYICEICGTEYADRNKALECEKGHHNPKKIKGKRYQPITNDRSGYPDRVDIEMDDGKIVTYKR